MKTRLINIIIAAIICVDVFAVGVGIVMSFFREPYVDFSQAQAIDNQILKLAVERELKIKL